MRFTGLKDGAFSLAGRLELVGIEPPEVLSILYDYSQRAAEIWGNVDQSSSRQLSSGSSVDLYEVQQTCSWRFALFSGQFDCRILVEQRKEEDSGNLPQLTFNLIESSFMKAFEGSWLVKRGSNGVIVEHLLSVRPMLDIPPALSALSQNIFCSQVHTTLEDLEKEVCRIQRGNN